MNASLQHKKIAVVGLGISNISVIRYLIKHDLSMLTIFDTRSNPPHMGDLPVGLDLRLGRLDAEVLKTYDIIVISPGISIYDEAIVRSQEAGVKVVGDIELFAHEAKAPIIGITGSNGKSTVTTLTGFIADAAGINVRVGANIGTPVFDILDDKAELYVLELSSFELETVDNLKLQSCAILNVSEDHLDRYHGSLDEYAKTKQRIFKNAKQVVVNRDDLYSYPSREDRDRYRLISFGLDNTGNYGIEKDKDQIYLTRNKSIFMNVKDLRVSGMHNYVNVLAALALTEFLEIPKTVLVKALHNFSGLPHRCQLVKTVHGVAYYNDSKATNVASVVAAIEGLKDIHTRGMILLAGGLGKGQDFTPLKKYIGHEVKTVFCFGKDKDKLLDLDKDLCINVENMEEAIHKANEMATTGQAVLLSPGCASFDQFKGFEHRGHVFADIVGNLAN